MKHILEFILFIISGIILLFKYVAESHCKCPTIWIIFYMLGAIICFILAVVIALQRLWPLLSSFRWWIDLK